MNPGPQQQPQQRKQDENTPACALRHTNNFQQLEHYQDYYKKQLDKMKAAAKDDPKFQTYVKYYEQKLMAVKRRRAELETRSLKKENEKKEAIASAGGGAAGTAVGGGGVGASAGALAQKRSSVMDVISPQKPASAPKEAGDKGALASDVDGPQSGDNEVDVDQQRMQQRHAQLLKQQHQQTAAAEYERNKNAADGGRENVEYSDPAKLTKIQVGGGDDPFDSLFDSIQELGYTAVPKPGGTSEDVAQGKV